MDPLRLVVIFVLVLPTIFCKDHQGCFTSSERRGRIVGGSDTKRNETPFIVSLTRRGGHFCGAAILSERWLVTAGHCLCNNLNNFMKPSQIRAVLGLYQISEYKNYNKEASTHPQPVEIPLESFIFHPEYDCKRASNDIALIEMKPVEFTSLIGPVCIANEGEESFEGVRATVSGWGWTHENQSIGHRSDTLQKANVDVWANSECAQSFKTHEKSIKITEKQLCAGRRGGGIDACWADSGGPLISPQGLLIGIVSTGIGCARPDLPGIYTRITEYAGWITEIIENSVK